MKRCVYVANEEHTSQRTLLIALKRKQKGFVGDGSLSVAQSMEMIL